MMALICMDSCRALVKSVAADGPVMVTWANLHYLDFTLNWVEHVRECGIKSFLVGGNGRPYLAGVRLTLRLQMSFIASSA